MESVFYFANGETVNSVSDLLMVLNKIDDNTFRHHCNGEKNDFYVWIRDGLGERRTATEIKKIKTQKGLIRKLNKLTAAGNHAQ